MKPLDIFRGFPRVLRIGPYDVKVKIVEKIVDEETGGECWGDFDIVTYELRLAKPLAGPLHAIDTVMHEIGHCIWKISAFRATAGEERVCAAFATCILQVVRDNPALIKWMSRHIGRKNHT